MKKYSVNYFEKDPAGINMFKVYKIRDKNRKCLCSFDCFLKCVLFFNCCLNLLCFVASGNGTLHTDATLYHNTP